MSLLKGGGSSTYVTILSPILTNMDNLGIGLGAMKSAVSVGSWLVKVRIGQEAIEIIFLYCFSKFVSFFDAAKKKKNCFVAATVFVTVTMYPQI